MTAGGSLAQIRVRCLTVEPARRPLKGGCGEAFSIIVPAFLLFPHVEIGLVPMREEEVDVGVQEAGDGFAQIWIESYAAIEPAQDHDVAQSSPIMLRPGPARDVQCAVRIDARLSNDPLGRHGGQFVIGSQILLKCGGGSKSPRLVCDQRTAVEPVQRQGESDEVAKIRERPGSDRPVLVKNTQCIDDDGGIAKPVKEIIRVGVPGGENRGSDDGTWLGRYRLAETRPRLDDAGRRDCGAHRYGRKGILPINPGIERFGLGHLADPVFEMRA